VLNYAFELFNFSVRESKLFIMLPQLFIMFESKLSYFKDICDAIVY